MDDSSMNKTIHEFLGKCWHEIEEENPKSLVEFNCTKCDWSESIMSDSDKLPDYTTDLNFVRTAELKVIDKFGADAYQASLDRIVDSASEDGWGTIDAIIAPANLRAAAVIDVLAGDEK